MRRGLVLFLCLYSSWSLAEARSAEVCRVDSDFVREVNHARVDLMIGADGEPRRRLIALLEDHATVVNSAGGTRLAELVRAITEDGAIVSSGLGGTLPDCVNVLTGYDAWARISSAEVAAR